MPSEQPVPDKVEMDSVLQIRDPQITRIQEDAFR